MEFVVILLCVAVIGFFTIRFMLKVRKESKRTNFGMPPGVRDILYVSSRSSGRSLKSWRTRWGAAKNCLKIVVTHDFLYTGVPDPLLRTVTKKYDLEHQIPKPSIEEVEIRWHFLSRKCVYIRYHDDQGGVHELELWPQRRAEFQQALGAGVEVH